DTRGRSPVRKSRTPGSVRGVSGNGYPYRDGYLYSYAVSRSKVRRENAGLPFGVVETPAY
ncbi:hypothetical protein B4U25_45520, partial [Klebsiella pneumoniae]